jgi:hypothetical protein
VRCGLLNDPVALASCAHNVYEFELCAGYHFEVCCSALSMVTEGCTAQDFGGPLSTLCIAKPQALMCFHEFMAPLSSPEEEMQCTCYILLPSGMRQC